MNDNSFYSIDRLVEFGMGMAMARQMVNIMNETIQTMYVPGSPNTIQSTRTLNLYVGIDGKPVGPLDENAFTRLVTEKKVTCSTFVWMSGMPGWKTVDQVPDVLRIIALTPPPIPNN